MNMVQNSSEDLPNVDTQQERRTYRRVKVSAYAYISSVIGGFDAELRDVSRGGAQLVVQHFVESFQGVVELFILGVNEEMVNLTSRIVRLQTESMSTILGLQFEQPVLPKQGQLSYLFGLLLNEQAGERRPGLEGFLSKRGFEVLSALEHTNVHKTVREFFEVCADTLFAFDQLRAGQVTVLDALEQGPNTEELRSLVREALTPVQELTTRLVEVARTLRKSALDLEGLRLQIDKTTLPAVMAVEQEIRNLQKVCERNWRIVDRGSQGVPAHAILGKCDRGLQIAAFAILEAFVKESPDQLLCRPREEIESAVVLRRAWVDLHAASRTIFAAFKDAPQARAADVRSQLLALLDSFANTQAYKLLRPADKQIFNRHRMTLFQWQTEKEQAIDELGQILKQLIRFLGTFRVLNQRYVLQIHDRQQISSLLHLLKQQVNEEKLLPRVGRLYGIDERLDAWIQSKRQGKEVGNLFEILKALASS